MDKYSIENLKTLHKNISKNAIDLWMDYSDRIRITCGFRGNEEQEILFKNHRSNAHGGQSYHNYGLAFDFCVLLPGGQVDYKFSKYKHVQEFIDLFKKNGWSYSGDWSKKGFTEEGHLEFNFYNLSELQAMKKDSNGYPIF